MNIRNKATDNFSSCTICSNNLLVLMLFLLLGCHMNPEVDYKPVEIDGKWGYANKHGRVVVDPVFEEAQFFSEGLAAVKIGSNAYSGGLSDFAVVCLASGDIGSNASWTIMDVAGRPGDWGYINRKGEMVIYPNYLQAEPFKNGRAKVLSAVWRVGVNSPNLVAAGSEHTYIDTRGNSEMEAVGVISDRSIMNP